MVASWKSSIGKPVSLALLCALLAASLPCARLWAQDNAAEDDAAEAGADPQQQELMRKYQSIRWQEGPCTAALGGVAQVKVPAGYHITDKAGTRVWSELTGNMPNDDDLGLLSPAPGSDHESDGFFIVFTFSDSGYVKDDDKDKLDAGAILESIRQGNDEGNKYRIAHGSAPLDIVGWMQAPAYDQATHNLCWAVQARSEGHDVINYNTRVLGRRGVMSINLVADPEDIPKLLPTSKQIVSNFEYNQGNRYAEFQAGDKVAAYGLTALVAGGAAVAAAKTGLLAKLAVVFAKAGKAIVIGILALLGGIAKFFKSFRRSAS